MTMPEHPSIRPTILFAGGGTAGHVMPGLAVAEQLVRLHPACRIVFVGSDRTIESRLVRRAGFDHRSIPAAPWPRHVRDIAAFLRENFSGYLAARRALDELRPSVVVGLGGYHSAPLGHAAARRGVPLVLLEQNALPGRATRWLAPRADAVLLAMDVACAALPHPCRAIVTGNPVREAFFRNAMPQRSPAPTRDEPGPRCDEPPSPLLIVLGGTHGAGWLNEQAPWACHRLGSRLAGWRIVHQSGPAQRDYTAAIYTGLGLRAEVVEFADDMPSLLADARLAVCRAGGTTLAELAAAGVPAILVPLPGATDRHQHCNAAVMADAGAALVVEQPALGQQTPRNLTEALRSLLDAPKRLDAMRRATARLARPRAARDAAEIVLRLCADQSALVPRRAAA